MVTKMPLDQGYYAGHYQQSINQAIFQHYRHHLKLVSGLLPNKLERVLDFGCGIGYLSKVLTEFFPTTSIMGFDISMESLRSTMVYTQARLACASAFALPYQDQSMDAVFAFGVLEHLEYLSIAGDEILRVLRQGGFLIMKQQFRLDNYQHNVKRLGRFLRSMNILKRPGKRPFSSKELHIANRRPAEWVQFLESINLEVEHVLPLSVLPPIYYIFPGLYPNFFGLPVISPIDRMLCQIPWMSQNLALTSIYISKKVI